MVQCVREGHTIDALANLRPKDKGRGLLFAYEIERVFVPIMHYTTVDRENNRNGPDYIT